MSEGITPDTGGETSSVLRSSAVMAVGTIVSRATGLINNVMLTAALGLGLVGGAFRVANTVPNMLYILLIGGALNSVFVPQLVRAMKEDADGGQAYADRLLTASTTLLVVITIAVTAAAPLIISVVSDYSGDQRALTVAFARYCLPQVLFYGLYVMFGQVLNARDRFGPMMWAPILNNVVAIGVYGAFIVAAHADTNSAASISSGEAAWLGVGTTVGIVVQAIVLVPVLIRSGFRWRLRFDWRGSGLGKAATLATWTFLFVLVNQIGFVVITRLSTSAESQAYVQGSRGVGFATYTNASLLFLLPHGIVTVSVVTALLPRISRRVAEGRLRAVRADLSHGMRVIGTAVVPAAAAFVALGPDIARSMYMFGHSNHAAATYTGYVLMAFGPGLVFYSLHYTMLRGFYAFEDTRTPFTINLWMVAVNVAVNVVLARVLPAKWVTLGLAASYSASYVYGFLLSRHRLVRRIGGIQGPRVLRTYVRLVIAAVVSAAAAFGVSLGVHAALGTGWAGSAASTAGGGLVMAALYVFLARRMHVEELTDLLEQVRRRRSVTRSGAGGPTAQV